jgi:ribonuclease HI
VVADCLPANVLLSDLWRVQFRPVAWLKSMFLRSCWAALFDFKAWYYQFSVERLRLYLCFRRGSKLFAFRRGVMGHKWFVAIGHSVTTALAELVATCCGVEFDTIIDNVAFFSPCRSRVDRASLCFTQLCSTLGMTIGEHVPSSTTFVYRGLCADLRKKTVALKPTFIGKTQARIEHVLRSRTVSKAQLQSLAGSLNWVHVVVPNCPRLAFIYHTLASLSNVGVLGAHRFIELPEDLAQELASVLPYLTAVVPLDDTARNPPANTNVYLFTDACKDITLAGKGVVLVTPLSVHEYVENFTIEELKGDPIHILELKALISGVRKLLPGSSVTLFCDNEAVVKALRKRRSSSIPFHRLIKEALQILSIHEWDIVWIPSRLNWADRPSRSERN